MLRKHLKLKEDYKFIIKYQLISSLESGNVFKDRRFKQGPVSSTYLPMKHESEAYIIRAPPTYEYTPQAQLGVSGTGGQAKHTGGLPTVILHSQEDVRNSLTLNFPLNR